jgi:hypothetical protein
VRELVHQIVLGRDFSPWSSTVSSWSTSPRAGMTAL